MGSLSCRHPTNLPPFLHVNIPPWQCPCGPEEILLHLLWVQPLATTPSTASHVRGGDVLRATCCRDGIPHPCALPSPSASTTHILPFRAAVLGPDLGLLDGSQVGASHSQQRPTTRDRDSGLGEAAVTLGSLLLGEKHPPSAAKCPSAAACLHCATSRDLLSPSRDLLSHPDATVASRIWHLPAPNQLS